MPLKPEVTTSPYGALLLIAGIVAVLLGAVVLPGLLYVAFWGVLVLLVVLAAFYVGQRIHRRLLGGRRR
jgi:hypothetical protein